MALDSEAAFRSSALRLEPMKESEPISQVAMKTSFLTIWNPCWELSQAREMLRTTAGSCSRATLKGLPSRIERSDTAALKIWPPLAEKAQRRENLKTKLPGIMLSTSMEPSHELIDRVAHQYEENCDGECDGHQTKSLATKCSV